MFETNTNNYENLLPKMFSFSYALDYSPIFVYNLGEKHSEVGV